MILFLEKSSGLHGELKVKRMETMRKGGDAEGYLWHTYKRKKSDGVNNFHKTKFY